MGVIFPDLYGLLLVLAGCLWGMAVGSGLWGDLGGLLGLAFGALGSFDLAEKLTLMLKEMQDGEKEHRLQSHLALASQSGRAALGNAKQPWLARIFGKRSKIKSPPEPDETFSLDEIHRQLRTLNSGLWKQLRSGVLCSCFVGIYEVQINETEESLDWREVNRRTVSAFRRFETAATDEERLANLRDILDLIGHKLLLVHKAALRKADKLNPEEERVIQQNESELWRLSRILRLP